MPIYEYECADCGQRIERLQRMDDPAPGPCEDCGGAMARQISAPAFQFKGTGWYVTDYKDGGSGSVESGSSEDSSSASKDGASEGKTESAAGEKAKPQPATSPATASKSSD